MIFSGMTRQGVRQPVLVFLEISVSRNETEEEICRDRAAGLYTALNPIHNPKGTKTTAQRFPSSTIAATFSGS